MTLIVGKKKIVARSGSMKGRDLVPPEDLGEDEVWHMTAWTTLAEGFLILRGSMLRETFPLFMELVEDSLQTIECEDYAELGRRVFRTLLARDFGAFSRGLSNLEQPFRDLLELRTLNPSAWGLFQEVLTQPMALYLDTPPAFRRLDAMARVFHALLEDMKSPPACVVVFAVPGPKGIKFLIGCNKPPTQKDAPTFLARKLFSMLSVSTTSNPDVILALEMGIDLLNVLPLEDCTVLRAGRVQRDLKKVRAWLETDLKIGDADSLAERLEFVPTFVPKKPVHGDMAALIWLLTEEQSPLDPKHALGPLVCSSPTVEVDERSGGNRPSWSLLPKGHFLEGQCYMGDSWLCCPYCAYVVSRYNRWAPENRLLLRIGARGYHTADQGGWRFVFDPGKVKLLKDRRLDRLWSFVKFLDPLRTAINLDRGEHIARERQKEQRQPESSEGERGRSKGEPQSEVLRRTQTVELESAFGAPPTIGFGRKFRQTISLRPSRSRSPSPVRTGQPESQDENDNS